MTVIVLIMFLINYKMVKFDILTHVTRRITTTVSLSFNCKSSKRRLEQIDLFLQKNQVHTAKGRECIIIQMLTMALVLE
jgi:hypothetical protein